MLTKSPTRISLLAGLLLVSQLLGGICHAADQTTQVRVTTSLGAFVIEVFDDRAPITAANFLRYVREGFYSNTLFHRVVANFVVQGGGHDATTLQLKPTHDLYGVRARGARHGCDRPHRRDADRHGRAVQE